MVALLSLSRAASANHGMLSVLPLKRVFWFLCVMMHTAGGSECSNYLYPNSSLGRVVMAAALPASFIFLISGKG